MFTISVSDLDPKYVFCMLWVRKMSLYLAKVVENGRFVSCCGKMCQTSMNFTSFIGQAQTAIDGKGRSSFPREFRRQLTAAEGSEFVVTRGPDRTLRLFTLPEYEKFMADLDCRSDRRQADLVRRNLWPTVVELDALDKTSKKALVMGILLTQIMLVLKQRRERTTPPKTCPECLAAGRKAARARRYDRDQIRALRAEGLMLKEIAARMGCHTDTVRKALREGGMR